MNAERGTRNAERGGSDFVRVLGDLTRSGLFPLTPALSPGERENPPPSSGHARDGVRQSSVRKTHPCRRLFPAHEPPPLPPFGHPLPLGGGEGRGEGAVGWFKGARRAQSSGRSLPEGEGQGEWEQRSEAAQFQRTPGQERTHA